MKSLFLLLLLLAPNSGDKAPLFFLKAYHSPNAPYVGLSRYIGDETSEPKKAVLLSFFATYCEPCKTELPFLAALDQVYRNQGLQILLVSTDTELSKMTELETLADKAKIEFPLLHDRYTIVAKRYQLSELPNNFLIQKNGTVALKTLGYSVENNKQLLDKIRQAIGEPLSAPIPEKLQLFFN